MGQKLYANMEGFCRVSHIAMYCYIICLIYTHNAQGQVHIYQGKSRVHTHVITKYYIALLGAIIFILAGKKCNCGV